MNIRCQDHGKETVVKMLFRWLFVLACLAPANSSYGAISDNGFSVNSMKAFLETSDLTHFVETMRLEKWSAPVIYSKWHVDNVMIPPNRENANAARAFGKLLAMRINDFAQKIRTTQESQELFVQSLTLLELTDWLNKSDGYGNFLLGSRCLDVAAVAIARCVADETFSLESIRQVVPRLRPSWMSPSVRQRILNKEAGAAVFDTSESDATKMHEHLRSIWQAGRELKLQASTADLDLQRELAQRPTHLDRERPEMKASARFFDDEKFVGQGATTSGRWDLKRHEEIIQKNPSSIATAEKLIIFRDTLGGFPKKNGVKYTDDAEGEKAFGWAWAPHGKDEESRQIGIAVWEAYRDIQRGKFLDEDSRNAEIKARLDKSTSPQGR